jgi:hypothetical protein
MPVITGGPSVAKAAQVNSADDHRLNAEPSPRALDPDVFAQSSGSLPDRVNAKTPLWLPSTEVPDVTNDHLRVAAFLRIKQDMTRRHDKSAAAHDKAGADAPDRGGPFDPRNHRQDALLYQEVGRAERREEVGKISGRLLGRRGSSIPAR